MTVKAKLIVRLLAGDTVVAESENADLWQQALAAINGTSGSDAAGTMPPKTDSPPGTPPSAKRLGTGPKEKMASDLDVSVEELEGACSPESTAPYIHLDEKSWEAFKKNTPKRGPKAVASLQLAGTLLCLWFKHAVVESTPTQADAQKVLGTIGEADKNPSRSIKNCPWLQPRSGGLRINAARHSQALAVARAYVKGTAIEAE